MQYAGFKANGYYIGSGAVEFRGVVAAASYGWPMHPNIIPIAAMVGTWTGIGMGRYPTIKDFDYHEQISFTDIGKPFLVYLQRTWGSEDGRPMHTEAGYLRPRADGHIELTMAQPTGQTESLEGEFSMDEQTLKIILSSRAVTNTSTAKQVDATFRRYVLRDDALDTAFDMAAVGQPMDRHLTSKLYRDA